MKRLWCESRCLAALSCTALLAGLSACAPLPVSDAPALERSHASAAGNRAEKLVVTKAVRDQARIERVPFVLGVSSVTVERMALRAACTGGSGAGRLTPPGPVEVYRMTCDDGKVFMARCELRQCTPM